MAYIELQDICKEYKAGTPAEVKALSEINLSIDQGELVAIIGKSGSGKSTLLHILGTIDRPTRGNYLLDGETLCNVPQKEIGGIRNKKIGFVLPQFGLLLNRSVYENVAVPLYFNKNMAGKDFQDQIHKTLEKVGILEKEKYLAIELSGGQKQRVAIARALVNDPDMILADEPTGALDEKTSKEIMDLLIHLNESGKTVIIVTHDPNVAARCKRIITLSDGKIISEK